MKTMFKVFAGLFLISFGVAAGAEQPSQTESASAPKQAANPALEARPATPEKLDGPAQQIKIWDRLEDQIQINSYVVEVSTNDDLFGGAHWSSTLGQNGATFTLSGDVAAPSMYPQDAFFNSGLILQAPTVQATIRALIQRGKLRPTNVPVAYARSGERVLIRAVQYKTIFLQPAASISTPYTLATGLTLDVIPRLLGGATIDLKIHTAFSAQTGTQQDISVPVISTRSTTADVQVRSGDAAVIGGITEDTDNYLINGIPGLRKIPLLEYLFNTRQKNRDRTNLVIIVWPKIIKGSFKPTDRVGAGEASSVPSSTSAKL